MKGIFLTKIWLMDEKKAINYTVHATQEGAEQECEMYNRIYTIKNHRRYMYYDYYTIYK